MRFLYALSGAIAGLLLASSAMPARGQACDPLAVVEGSGTQVSKTVSPPGTFLTDNNWNTDFIVPQGSAYSRYVAKITPQSSGDFTIKMFLKYRDDTADKAYDRSAVPLGEGETTYVEGAVRTGAQPYQINLVVGGIAASGESYTASVMGCR